jgi:hypothetical protein
MNYVLRNSPLVYRINVWVVRQRMLPGERPRTTGTYKRWCRSTASLNNSGRTYSSGATITAKKHN